MRGISARIRIRLEKGIPAAAGLGGGSSDAAAVLRGLAGLVEGGAVPVSKALSEAALGLGADVPFFLDPRPSLVTGIGEVITPLDGLPSADLVIANPGISLDTAEVYRTADALGSALTEPRPGSTMRAFSRLSRENGDPREGFASHSPTSQASDSGVPDFEFETESRPRELWSELLINDLEPAARRLCPQVGRLLSAMREAGAIGAGMTGSGATVFGVFESNVAAVAAADWLRRTPAAESGPVWIQVSRLIGHRSAE